MGESSPSVESMGRGMDEVRELSPVQRFAIVPTPRNVARLWVFNECNRLISSTKKRGSELLFKIRYFAA